MGCFEMPTPESRKFVLVGGGHAHIQVLEDLAENPLATMFMLSWWSISRLQSTPAWCPASSLGNTRPANCKSTYAPGLHEREWNFASEGLSDSIPETGLFKPKTAKKYPTISRRSTSAQRSPASTSPASASTLSQPGPLMPLLRKSTAFSPNPPNEIQANHFISSSSAEVPAVSNLRSLFNTDCNL